MLTNMIVKNNSNKVEIKACNCKKSHLKCIKYHYTDGRVGKYTHKFGLFSGR